MELNISHFTQSTTLGENNFVKIGFGKHQKEQFLLFTTEIFRYASLWYKKGMFEFRRRTFWLNFFLNHGQARSYINVYHFKYWDKIKCFHRILLLSTVSSDSGCLVRFRDVFRFLDLHLESLCAHLEAIHGLNSRLCTLSRGVGDKPCKWKANDFQSEVK